MPETLTDGETIAALRDLPQHYAEVVVLADVQEFPYKEIQDALRAKRASQRGRGMMGLECIPLPTAPS